MLPIAIRKAANHKLYGNLEMHPICEGGAAMICSVSETSKSRYITYYDFKVQAGFPSPADDYMSGKIDLNHHLIKNPSATFIIRVVGNAMIGAGIYDGDEIIVDRSMIAKHGKVIVASVNGDLKIRRFYQQHGLVKLVADNIDYQDIIFHIGEAFDVWGVATRVLHKL